ncbi:MAG: hypothetical protein PHZ24_14610, partial [Bacteroidales bacterium]|nr:hypothetical protein [Bacteroidales bacterium]
AFPRMRQLQNYFSFFLALKLGQKQFLIGFSCIRQTYPVETVFQHPQIFRQIQKESKKELSDTLFSFQ